MTALDELEEIKELVNDNKKFKYKNIVNFNCDCIKDELEYADKCHNLEEELGCPLEEIIEFIKLLKKYYYVGITGHLESRSIWNNKNLNEKELYRINHIFNDIKDKSE